MTARRALRFTWHCGIQGAHRRTAAKSRSGVAERGCSVQVNFASRAAFRPLVPSVATRLRRIDNVRMDFLREMFGSFVADPDEVEARSTLVFALAIGRHFIAADTQGAPGAKPSIWPESSCCGPGPCTPEAVGPRPWARTRPCSDRPPGDEVTKG